MANARGAGSAERHRFDSPRPRRKISDEPVDRYLVAAENEGGERMRRGGDAGEGFVQSAIGKNRQDRTEYLILHDRIVPYDRIDDRRIEISRVGV
jgi:hypothetical protein